MTRATTARSLLVRPEDGDHRFGPGTLHDDRDLVGVQVCGGVNRHPASCRRQVQARGTAGIMDPGRDRRRVKCQLRDVSPASFASQDVQPRWAGAVGVNPACHSAVFHLRRRRRPGRRALRPRQSGQARLGPADHSLRVIPQRCQAADDAAPVACHAVAEHVAGEDDVTECRVPPGLPTGVLVKAGTTMDKQHARPHARNRLIPAQYAGQRSLLIPVRPIDRGNIHC
jgi:hypothetical protein